MVSSSAARLERQSCPGKRGFDLSYRVPGEVHGNTVLIVVLSGCVSAPKPEPAGYWPKTSADFQPHSLTRAEAYQVEADVRAHLQTSDALFSGLRAAKADTGEHVVCGWVRKRDFDRPHFRYPLNRPFAASYSGRPARGADSVHYAGERSEASALYIFCSQRGISM